MEVTIPSIGAVTAHLSKLSCACVTCFFTSLMLFLALLFAVSKASCACSILDLLCFNVDFLVETAFSYSVFACEICSFCFDFFASSYAFFALAVLLFSSLFTSAYSLFASLTCFCAFSIEDAPSDCASERESFASDKLSCRSVSSKVIRDFPFFTSSPTDTLTFFIVTPLTFADTSRDSLLSIVPVALMDFVRSIFSSETVFSFWISCFPFFVCPLLTFPTITTAAIMITSTIAITTIFFRCFFNFCFTRAASCLYNSGEYSGIAPTFAFRTLRVLFPPE